MQLWDQRSQSRGKCAGELVSVPDGKMRGQSCSLPVPTLAGMFLLTGRSFLPATLCDTWTVCCPMVVLAELSAGVWDASGKDEGRSRWL